MVASRYPVDNILRTIDALSWNKFNRLHIHMSDSQSWPLEIPAIPELAKKGAYQTGLSYSPSEFETIQEYGTERGVQVYIEFDMPGHTTSIYHSHPELITAANAKPCKAYLPPQFEAPTLKHRLTQVQGQHIVPSRHAAL